MRVLISCLFLYASATPSSITSPKSNPAIPPADISIRLSVDPEAGLPSVPPTLRIEVHNNGNTSALFPVFTNLSVERTNREPHSFLAYTEDRGSAIGEVLEDATEAHAMRLAARETRTYTLWSAPDRPRWWSDTRLWSAGTYTLQLIVPGPPRYESNKVTYVVLQPEGADAGAWEAIKQARRSGTGPADIVARDYPDSTYARYYVADGATDEDLIRNLERALERPDIPPGWRDNWRLALGKHLQSKAHKLLHVEKDVDRAIAAAERSAEILEQTAKTAVDEFDRAEAQKELDHRMTRDGILETWGILNGIYPDRMTPEAQCIERTADGKTLLWFGYANSKNEDLDIAVGEQNKFTPAPHDRGQPTHFKSGFQWKAFSVSLGNEQSLTWHLYKDAVHVKIKDVTPCKQPDKELWLKKP